MVEKAEEVTAEEATLEEVTKVTCESGLHILVVVAHLHCSPGPGVKSLTGALTGAVPGR